jgi:mannosyltransferase OCH1-like enzyme
MIETYLLAILIIIMILYIIKFNRIDGFTTRSIISIPKIIHLCYKTKDIPDFIIKNWTKLNPDYKVIIYDNNDCIEFLLKYFGQKHVDIFNHIKDGPIKADFWRVCILYIYGGIYCDIDVEPLVPIKSFMEKDVDFLTCSSMTENLLNPHLIISPANHIVLKQCIDRYIELYDTNYKYSYWGWSIVYIMNDILYKLFGKYINKEGIYILNGMKYQFIKEIYTLKSHDIHCVYKNTKILNNRYKDYDNVNHKFERENNILIQLINKIIHLFK